MAASEGLIHKYVFFVMLMHSVIFGLLFYALLKLLGKSHKKGVPKLGRSKELIQNSDKIVQK